MESTELDTEIKRSWISRMVMAFNARKTSDSSIYDLVPMSSLLIQANFAKGNADEAAAVSILHDKCFSLLEDAFKSPLDGFRGPIIALLNLGGFALNDKRYLHVIDNALPR